MGKENITEKNLSKTNYQITSDLNESV